MTAVALASTISAPKYDWTPAEETLIIEGNSISALANKNGVDLKDPKLILGDVSIKYGVDYDTLYRVINCESGFRHEQLFGDSGKAYGIGQFHRDTFERWNTQRGLTLDYYNLKDQLDMMAWAFSKGYQHNWSCY